jgi:uncharacterized protein DUF6600
MLRRMLAAVMVLATILGVSSGVRAQAVESDVQAADATPPRLSYTTGAVSFWRPGGDDWAPAQVNTPLAEGDELYTGPDGNLELQVGGRGFVRAWGDTQVGLINHDPNFLQLRVAAGHVALDLRALDAGDVVEVDTPGAAFTIDQAGYYRVDVSADRTSFSTRRSGRAAMTTASGPAPAIAPGEAVVVENGAVRRLAAPELDVWDKWNDARTAALVTTVSAPYVPAQIYGANELDRYGSWRSDATYGSVWVPANVATDWAPYSTGRWIWDPRFGWTWLDAAPWGWAPYHYGRWVSLGGVWAWAPGPVVVRPAYAPALVAFFGTPVGGVQVTGPSIGWVALGWGEPVVPWWGRAGFVGRPWWGGWGGPRVQHVTVYRNVTVVNAVVAVRSDRFGRGGVQEARIPRPDVHRLQPVRGRLDVKPDPTSFRGANGHAQRPPDEQINRRVVSTRPPVQRLEPPHARDDRRDARPDARRDQQQPGVRNDPRPDGRSNPRPDVRRDAKRPTPRVEPPRADVRRPDDPRTDSRSAPRVEPRRVDAPRVEPPRVQAPRPETPRIEPRVEPRRPDVPRVEPRVEAPRPETPRVEPRVEPRRSDVPRVERPPVQAPRPETPRVEPPRVQAPRPETPRVEPPRVQAPRPETPRVEPRVEPRRPDVPRVEPPRVDIRRPEPPRAEAPRMETPRRAAAPANLGRPEATRPAVQHRPEPARTAPPARPQAQENERARHGR